MNEVNWQLKCRNPLPRFSSPATIHSISCAKDFVTIQGVQGRETIDTEYHSINTKELLNKYMHMDDNNMKAV